jgi:hypothetical protein
MKYVKNIVKISRDRVLKNASNILLDAKRSRNRIRGLQNLNSNLINILQDNNLVIRSDSDEIIDTLRKSDSDPSVIISSKLPLIHESISKSEWRVNLNGSLNSDDSLDSNRKNVNIPTFNRLPSADEDVQVAVRRTIHLLTGKMPLIGTATGDGNASQDLIAENLSQMSSFASNPQAPTDPVDIIRIAEKTASQYTRLYGEKMGVRFSPIVSNAPSKDSSESAVKPEIASIMKRSISTAPLRVLVVDDSTICQKMVANSLNR